jgi:hypothetical protein
MEIMQGQHRVVLFLKPEYHKQLLDMSLKRGAEIGTRVSMGFVIQELLEREKALDKGLTHVAKATEEMFEQQLFASHD